MSEVNSATLKKCLLIISKHFYSFEKHIREALVVKGYEVTVSNDEYPEGTFGRILGKLQIPIIFPITYKRVVKDYLDGKKYDLCLIFKGRGMSEKLIKRIKESADNVVGYNWDSFKLNRSPLKWYKFTDKYYTFDYRDADKYDLPIIELFSASTAIIQNKEIKYDISAVVRNHSGRLAYIDKVLTALKPERPFIFIFENSRLSYLLNFLKNPGLTLKYKQYISFIPLKYAEYSDAIKSSAFTIDYAHYTQTGITMRCFESINVHTKIITNNKHIKRSSKYFNDSNCIVFEEKGDTKKLSDDYKACKTMPYQAPVRTITNFIDDLVKV